MSKICNCKITKVGIDITETFNINVKLRFSFRTNHAIRYCEKNFFNIEENIDFHKIMEYAGIKKVNMLKDRIVRCIIENNKIIGVGDPIEDKFILFNSFGAEFSKNDLK